MKYIIDFNNREDSDFLRTVRVLTDLEVDFNIIDFWNVHSCEKEYHIAIPFLEYITRLRDINKNLNFDLVCISSKIFFELQLQYSERYIIQNPWFTFQRRMDKEPGNENLWR